MNINIKSYTQGLKQLTNWYKSDSKYFYLVGCTGSGKTTILNEFCKNINHKYYDCYHKITKKELSININEMINTTCVMHYFNNSNEMQLYIFDEFDDFQSINNISFNDILKVFEDKDCKIILSITKFESKSIICEDKSVIYKIDPCNVTEIKKILKSKHLQCNFKAVSDGLKNNYSDIRHVINSVELNVYDSKQYNSGIENLKQCKNQKQITYIDDVYNLLLSFHECYPSFEIHNTEVEFISNLINADIFYTYMFDKQLWDVNKYGIYCIYNNIVNTNIESIKIYPGSMWSKKSNAQYKKKLYNNFVYSKNNIIFQYNLFLYNLKYYIIEKAKSNSVKDIKNMIKYLKMDIRDVEELIKITDFDNYKISYKGKLKKVITSAVKELKIELTN